MYVFDDLDPVETSYLGVAQVPLTALAQGHTVNGRFQLTEVRTGAAFTLVGYYMYMYTHGNCIV